eukprot:21121-Pelagococcus_subviridis.AAC.5
MQALEVVLAQVVALARVVRGGHALRVGRERRARAREDAPWRSSSTRGCSAPPCPWLRNRTPSCAPKRARRGMRLPRPFRAIA